VYTIYILKRNRRDREVHTINFVNFVSQISSHLALNGIYDKDWIESQTSRLFMMWNAGETVESAYETISQFAEAQLGSKSLKHLNPLSLPHCVGVRPV